MPEEEIYFWSSDENSEWGEIRTNKFGVNPNANKRFWVVDNFYDDPQAVREYALAQTYYPGEGAVGSRTRKQFFFKGVVEKFEEIMQKEIMREGEHGWHMPGINGRFQWSPAGTTQVYHCDEQQYAAMVFLTPDAPPECGTGFFQCKRTKRRHNQEVNWSAGEGSIVFPGDTFLDGTRYELVDKVGNVFNRLVIFDGGLIHSALNYFGSKIDNSRLHHMFFFNCVGEERTNIHDAPKAY